MPALAVLLNGEHIVTVAADGMDLVDVRVSGDLLGPEPAIVDVTGGTMGEGSDHLYLTWVSRRALAAGDSLEVTFLPEGVTSSPGKTVDELYPEMSGSPPPAFQPIEEVVRELIARPKHFESIAVSLRAPDGTMTKVRTKQPEYGFAFSMSWASHRADKVRVSLHTYTLQSLLDRANGTYHADYKLGQGQTVAFNVGA